MNHCTSFIQNDPELRDYLRITPNHKLDQKYLKEVTKKDPNVSFKLGTQDDDGVIVDEISFPSGTATKTIYVRRINGKLERIELNRTTSFFGPGYPQTRKSTTKQLTMDDDANASKASGRSIPKHESRLSLAIALHSDCQKATFNFK